MKKPIVICLVAGLLFAAVPLAVHSVFRDRLTFGNYRLLEEGISEAEVKRILGGRCSLGPALEGMVPPSWDKKKIARVGFWSNRYATISVGFDDNGTLRGKIFTVRPR